MRRGGALMALAGATVAAGGMYLAQVSNAPQETAPEVAGELLRAARVAPSWGGSKVPATTTPPAATPPASPRAAHGAALATPARESTGPALFLWGFEGGGFGGFAPVRPHGPIFADGFESAPRWSHVVGGSLVPLPPLDVVSVSEHRLVDRWRTVVHVVARRATGAITVERADGSRWVKTSAGTWWEDEAGGPACPCVLEVWDGRKLWRAPLTEVDW